jgi:hypothetical protein
MSDLDTLISDILCHVTDDGELRLSKLELHDLITRLIEINAQTEALSQQIAKLREIIGKPLVSLIDDFEMIKLHKVQGE